MAVNAMRDFVKRLNLLTRPENMGLASTVEPSMPEPFARGETSMLSFQSLPGKPKGTLLSDFSSNFQAAAKAREKQIDTSRLRPGRRQTLLTNRN